MLYCSVKFDSKSTLCTTFICPCCVRYHPGRFIKEQTGHPHSACSCSTHPHKLSLARSRLYTSIPSSLRIPPLQSLCPNPRPLPPTQPLRLQRKSRHYHPRQPCSTDSEAPHHDLQWFQGVSPLPAAAPAPFDSKAPSRVTLQSENVNQAAGHRGSGYKHRWKGGRSQGVSL